MSVTIFRIKYFLQGNGFLTAFYPKHFCKLVISNQRSPNKKMVVNFNFIWIFAESFRLNVTSKGLLDKIIDILNLCIEWIRRINKRFPIQFYEIWVIAISSISFWIFFRKYIGNAIPKLLKNSQINWYQVRLHLQGDTMIKDWNLLHGKIGKKCNTICKSPGESVFHVIVEICA